MIGTYIKYLRNDGPIFIVSPTETPHKSVFREREQFALQPDLGQEFLDEMERERMEEEEEQYRQTLRRLWGKYQQQENSIERQLFEEPQEDLYAEDEEENRKRSFNLDERKKRYGYLPAHFGPAPLKRRDYPLLPWLTNDDDARKKRFPVAKRSAKPMHEEMKATGTSAKVAKDLQSLFSTKEVEGKTKRSADVAMDPVKSLEETHGDQTKIAHSLKEPLEEEDEDDEQGGHTEHEADDHDHEHDISEEDSDENDEERKKKRDVSAKSTPEVVKDDQIIPGDLSDFKKKKAVWNKYFGYDKRKKSVNWAKDDKYQSMTGQANDEGGRSKKQMDPEKLDSMGEKLKNIEDLIIEETVKYTGAHEGVSSPEQIQKLKDHVISRLATAYSLEKMRRALDHLRDSVDTERHLLQNEVEAEGGDEGEKKKRIANKKDLTHTDRYEGGWVSCPGNTNNNWVHVFKACRRQAEEEPQ